MSKYEYISIENLDEGTGTAIREMFREMYREMRHKGLLLPLDEQGDEKWLHSVRKTLGRYSNLVVARSNGEMAGFAHGALKFTPDYLGSEKVGVITHIYVDKAHRNEGVGEVMLRKLEDWFHARQVRSVELQVLAGNEEGIGFWNRSGYAKELLQYRKIVR